MSECNHPCCGPVCRKMPKPKKVYELKRTPIKKKNYKLKRTPIKKKKPAKSLKGVFKMSELLQYAQIVFNKWVRYRDAELPCISSGGRVEQAGHYKPAGSYSGVRFDEMNVNGQSVEDNCGKAGNEKEYRIGLIARYGEAAVVDLEERASATRFKKWTREELEDIINKYKIKTK